MLVSNTTSISQILPRKAAKRSRHLRRVRGLSLPMALMFVALFGTLTGSMMLFSQSTVQTAHGHEKVIQARAAAESGLAFGIAQLNLMAKPKTPYGTLDPAIYPTLAKSLFQNGVSMNFAAQFDGKALLNGKTCTVTSTSVTVPPIRAFGTLDDSQFRLILTQDATDPTLLHLTSIGYHLGQLAGVTIDIQMEKKIKYAVYSNVAIQLGKNVVVDGDVVSKMTSFSKGPPVWMLSDFRAINSTLDTDLSTLRSWLKSNDKSFANRVAVTSLRETQLVDAYNKGLIDRKQTGATPAGQAIYSYADWSADGYIDDYDMFIKRFDSAAKDFGNTKVVSTSEFTSATTGKLYDSELFYLIDHLKPPLNIYATNPVYRDGWADNVISDDDPYAKIRGSVQFAVTKAAWDSWAAGTGSTYGGTSFEDMFQGPVQSSDPTVAAVQFGVPDYLSPSLTTADFDTTSFRNLSGPASDRTTVVNVNSSGGTVQNATFSTSTIQPNGWVLQNADGSALSADSSGQVYYPGTSVTVTQKNGYPVLAKRATLTRTSTGYKINGTSTILPMDSSGNLLNPKTSSPMTDINGNKLNSTTTLTLPVNTSNQLCLPDTNVVVTGTKTGSTYTTTQTTALTAANVSQVIEEVPFGSTSYRATYMRPVYSNITFDNCIFPTGTNALFVNCTFKGVTYVDVNTSLTTTTSAKMLDGTSFSSSKVLTSSNSYGFNQGNNLRFESCTFAGPLFASNPTNYTDYTNSWEFTGATYFSLDKKYAETGSPESGATIEAPNTNIEMGSFSNPSSAPSTMIGVVVAGNIDIRGRSYVDGSVIVSGTGASNTTLGYFGPDDGQSSLTAMPEGGYGRLYMRYNPTLALPYGINIPIVLTAKRDSYRVITRTSDGVTWP